MELSIKGNDSIKKVKEDFHAKFPNLKIEFFYHGHFEGEGSPAADMVKGDVTVNELQSHTSDGNITYSGSMKIGDLESVVKEKFGLNIQVFRKASRVWLETMNSDNWTLDEANKHAQEMYENE
jgi:hypothetical protein